MGCGRLIYRNPLHTLSALRRFGSRHRQDAVAEFCLDAIFVDAIQGKAALEPAVNPLAESTAAVLRLRSFLAAQNEHAVLHEDFDILLIHAGKLGADAILGLGVLDLDLRPAAATAPQGRDIEAAEDIVEQSIHLAMQGEHRMLAGGRNRGSVPFRVAVPGYKITHVHDNPPFWYCVRAGAERDRRRLKN